MTANNNAFGYLLAAIGVASFLVSIGVYFSIPAATQFWVWPEAPFLNLAFVGAWFAGGNIALIWIGISRQYTAFRALMLTLILAMGGSAAHLYLVHQAADNERFLQFSYMFAGTALAALILFMITRPLGKRPSPQAPAVIRWVFVLFAAILVAVGSVMAFGVHNVFPAPLAKHTAALYGWMFLGSSVYYGYGALKPRLDNVTAQMMSFLVYDVMLIPPFAMELDGIEPALRVNLVVYLAVLVGSALFCIYFLFVDRRTRLIAQLRQFTP